MKLLAALLFLVFSFFSPSEVANTDSKDEEKIAWSASKPLTWNDFKGQPQRVAGYVASTNSGVSFSYSYRTRGGTTKLDYEVQSYFYPNLSWYVQEGATFYILKHEQTHFDISELHARILRKRLAAARFSDSLKEEIEAIYHKVEEERRAMQSDFDDGSDHSKNKAGERRWEQFVAEQLQAYDRWK